MRRLKLISFIEEEGGKKLTKQPHIFKWTPPFPGYKFNGNTNSIKTDGLPGVEKTANLQAFSFVVSLKMTKQPKKP